MTTFDIINLRQVSETYHRLLEQVEPFCLIVAKELGYDSVENVSVCNGYVCFTMEWYGPYQAFDSTSFNLAVDLLTHDPKELGMQFAAEMKANAERVAAVKKADEREEKKKLLARLKTELGEE